MPRNLLMRKRRWYVRVAVPRPLWSVIGRQEIVRTTGTGDLRQAERRKPAIVAAILDEIDTLKVASPAHDQWLLRQAMGLRRAVARGDLDAQLATEIMHDLRDRSTAPTHQKVMATRLSHDLDYLPLTELVESYLKEREPHVVASTVHRMRVELAALCGWLPEGTEISEVDRKVAGRYLSALLDNPTRSLTTAKHSLTYLSAFFNWTIRRGYYTQANPWSALKADLKGSRRGGTTARRRAWTPDELRKIDSLPKNDPAYAVLRIAMYTGARLNEITHLRVDDYLPGEQLLVVREGKTASSVRQIPLHPEIQPLVRQLAASSPDGWLIGGLKEGGQDHKRGHALSKRMGRWIRQHVSDDPGVVTHSLRSTFITQCERQGIPESTVKLIVGHARQSLTFGVYSKGLEVDQLREAVEKVSYFG